MPSGPSLATIRDLVAAVTPGAHTHAEADITGLVADLAAAGSGGTGVIDGGAPDSTYLDEVDGGAP